MADFAVELGGPGTKTTSAAPAARHEQARRDRQVHHVVVQRAVGAKLRCTWLRGHTAGTSLNICPATFTTDRPRFLNFLKK